jgi:uncharacterized protein (DUF924 family)
MSDIDAVLDFWFADGMPERWFKKDAAFDAEVRTRLAAAYESAAAGGLDDWRDSPEGCLALCILLDQVPRNMFRDDPRAFATDAKALAITRHALAHGFDRRLGQSRRMFLYLPLEHSERLADQELCCALMAPLDQNPAWHDYAVRHRDIVARFGRFPHRNAVLGRATTPAEAAFLAEAGSSF